MELLKLISILTVSVIGAVFITKAVMKVFYKDKDDDSDILDD